MKSLFNIHKHCNYARKIGNSHSDHYSYYSGLHHKSTVTASAKAVTVK